MTPRRRLATLTPDLRCPVCREHVVEVSAREALRYRDAEPGVVVLYVRHCGQAIPLRAQHIQRATKIAA